MNAHMTITICINSFLSLSLSLSPYINNLSSLYSYTYVSIGLSMHPRELPIISLNVLFYITFHIIYAGHKIL